MCVCVFFLSLSLQYSLVKIKGLLLLISKIRTTYVQFYQNLKEAFISYLYNLEMPIFDTSRGDQMNMQWKFEIELSSRNKFIGKLMSVLCYFLYVGAKEGPHRFTNLSPAEQTTQVFSTSN